MVHGTPYTAPCASELSRWYPVPASFVPKLQPGQAPLNAWAPTKQTCASSGTLGAAALAARADAVERAVRAGRPMRASARDLADDLTTFRTVVQDARRRLGVAHGTAVAS